MRRYNENIFTLHEALKYVKVNGVFYKFCVGSWYGRHFKEPLLSVLNRIKQYIRTVR